MNAPARLAVAVVENAPSPPVERPKVGLAGSVGRGVLAPPPVIDEGRKRRCVSCGAAEAAAVSVDAAYGVGGGVKIVGMGGGGGMAWEAFPSAGNAELPCPPCPFIASLNVALKVDIGRLYFDCRGAKGSAIFALLRQ